MCVVPEGWDASLDPVNLHLEIFKEVFSRPEHGLKFDSRTYRLDHFVRPLPLCRDHARHRVHASTMPEGVPSGQGWRGLIAHPLASSGSESDVWAMLEAWNERFEGIRVSPSQTVASPQTPAC